jgi:uncharacterized protein YydD (DUF2326 family)
MILNKIYSEPLGLFNSEVCKDGVIHFKSGINFIFGKKDPNNPTDSLNGIGKSFLLDLVDFCLLAGIKKNDNPRLHEAQEHLTGFVIILEFEIEEQVYLIKRSFETPDKVEFGLKGQTKVFEEKKELSEVLCNLIFKNPDYAGYYDSNLLRKLLPFFLKIHKPGKDKFNDPIEYVSNCKPTELNQYHLFFMGINNSILHKNYEIQSALSDKEPALKEIKKFVLLTYGLKKITEVDSQVDSLNKEIKKLEMNINNFRLAEEYKDTEQEANRLTEEIKEEVYNNFSDSKKIEQYKSSIEIKDDLKNLRKIQSIYSDLNEILGEKIKKTLADAVTFRNKLSNSRKKFLLSEIEELQENINVRDQIIKMMEEQRAKLFEFLKAKAAIKDLTEAFTTLNEKKKRVGDLEGRVKLYNDINKEKAKLLVQETEVQEQILIYLDEIKSDISSFRDIFSEVYNKIYPENKNKSVFSIAEDLGKKQKISIDITFPAMRSEGKNQGRTLIYDIAILLNAIEKNIKCPRFLAHDGIFDGMDKAHFVAVCSLLHSIQKSGKQFQYIVPINEEGTLNEKFGDVDEVTLEKIESEAIVILTPSKKLLGKTW